MLYLLKPFTFAAFRGKLEQYAEFRAQLERSPGDVVQDDVDQLFGALRARPTGDTLPKGMSLDSLRAVVVALRARPEGLSAGEAAEEVATYERDLAEIKSDGRLLKWITGTTLAGVLALVLRVFTSRRLARSSCRR